MSKGEGPTPLGAETEEPFYSGFDMRRDSMRKPLARAAALRYQRAPTP